jgi:hypothetical protein
VPATVVCTHASWGSVHVAIEFPFYDRIFYSLRCVDVFYLSDLCHRSLIRRISLRCCIEKVSLKCKPDRIILSSSKYLKVNYITVVSIASVAVCGICSFQSW